jgi:tight adherence protein E
MMNMVKKIRAIITNEKGNVSVEFAIVFVPFIVTVLFIMEICRVVYLSSCLDLVLAESGYIASITSIPEKHGDYFTTEINKRLAAWPLFSRNEAVELSITYCGSISAMTNNMTGCSETIATGNPLAMYKVLIKYRPLFFILPKNDSEYAMSRRIVFVQEFNRP